MIRVCDLSIAIGTYPTKKQRVRNPSCVGDSSNLKTALTGLLFLLEQAPRPIARDGQDELVVRAERDACHGECVAFERPPERPERFRVVDPDHGVLRSRGPASRREQLARRGDADGDGLEKNHE